MLSIGITGGIGSGKTTVCRIFSVLGIPIFQADKVARKLQNENPVVKQKLKELFGDEIYSDFGLLNRKKMAEIVFRDSSRLSQLNNVIHPAVHMEFANWKENHSNSVYMLYEAAILFETGSSHRFDYTILVVADEAERIKRVTKRDGAPSEAIQLRIDHQMKDEEKIKLADFILENNDDQLIIPQILKLDQILKAKNHVWKMDR